MAIPQKMESTAVISIKNATFTEYKSISVIIKQDSFERSYTPSILSDTQISFTIPADDAMRLTTNKIRWQVLIKDANDSNLYTDIKTTSVDEILGGRW